MKESLIKVRGSIEIQSGRLVELETDVQVLKEQVTETRTNMIKLAHHGVGVANTNASMISLINLTLPVFGAGPGDRPVRFIKAFMKYLKAVDADVGNFKFIVNQALRGPAWDWWEHVKLVERTPDQFQERFLSRYWSNACKLKYEANSSSNIIERWEI